MIFSGNKTVSQCFFTPNLFETLRLAVCTSLVPALSENMMKTNRDRESRFGLGLSTFLIVFDK